MELELAERVVVVTGGTSGVGRAAVGRFLAEGANVAFCARRADQVDATARAFAKDHGERVLGAVADVLDDGAMRSFAAAVRERFGRADVLVLNAGTARMKPLEALTDADWTDELGLKFFGTLKPIQAFWDLLAASDIANLVYISSLLAKQPELRLISTSAARAGVLNLMKSLSVAYAPKVRVNSILLGVIDTGQWERRWRERVAAGESITRAEYDRELASSREIPLARIGRPEEIADAIAFLASPRSGFTTGASLEISGGASRGV